MRTINSRPSNYYLFLLIYFILALILMSFNVINKELNRKISLEIQQFSASMNLLFTKDIAATYTNFFTSAKTIQNLQETNEKLSKEIAELHAKVLQITILEEKLAQLNSLLGIKNNKAITEITTTQIMSNHFAPLNTTLNIPLGKKHGIQTNALVISSLGIVGYTSNIYEKNSTIITTINPIFKISARSEQSKINVILNGNNTTNPYLTIYSKNTNLIEGETLLTSGLEGHFPQNIPIGRIIKGKKDNWQIQLFENFSQINYVHIVK